MKDSLNVAVIGATGYVGLELIKILSKHPNVKIIYLCARKAIGKKITRFDKTIKKDLPKIVINKDYKMRFDTNINSTLDWKFTPEVKTLNLKPGEVHTVKFFVENPNNQISSGSSSFNVSPAPFGIYLNKIGCFCFEKQTLKPGEKREFILTFFLDPKVVDDNKTKNVADVTLSFTFFSTDYYKKDKV